MWRQAAVAACDARSFHASQFGHFIGFEFGNFSRFDLKIGALGFFLEYLFAGCITRFASFTNHLFGRGARLGKFGFSTFGFSTS